MSVIEGTTDPKPAAGYTNPDTALTDPSTRIVGILEEANGAYTYHFATDVTTPLLMADAVDKRNVSLGKVANNGQLAVRTERPCIVSCCNCATSIQSATRP